MRLFVAIYPSEAVRAHLSDRLAGLTARLTPADRWHITLRFLGEASAEDTIRTLDAVPPIGNLKLHLAGGGRFGRVRWAGVGGELERLRHLAAAVGAEPREFTPHLTVSYHDSDDVRRALAGYRGPDWTVDEVVLVQSLDGYHKLRSWPL